MKFLFLQLLLLKWNTVHQKVNIEKKSSGYDYFLSSFGNILDFTTDDSVAYGIIRAYLEKIGKVIDPYDMQIAAQGLSRNLTVITNNYDEFSRIPELKVEDWTKE